MSLSGNLKDLPLADIFEIIKLSNNTGVLSLEQPDRSPATLVFLRGKLYSAWSKISKSALARELKNKNLPGIPTEKIDDAETQLHRVSSHLIEHFPGDQVRENLYRAVMEQCLADLMRWKEGSFLFETRQNDGEDLSSSWIFLKEPFELDHFLLEFAKTQDERLYFKQTGASGEALVDLAEELRDQFEGKPDEREEEARGGLPLLKTMLLELNSPHVHTYVTLLVLRYASSIMNRSIMFKVHQGDYVSIGEFGLNLDHLATDPNGHCRVKIPQREESFLNARGEQGSPLKIKPDEHLTWNKRFYELLGTFDIPEEVFIAPIFCDKQLVAVLYGDNFPEKKPIGDTEAFEVFLSQAGYALEKAMREQ